MLQYELEKIEGDDLYICRLSVNNHTGKVLMTNSFLRELENSHSAENTVESILMNNSGLDYICSSEEQMQSYVDYVKQFLDSE
jgi:hypothetical protein